MPQVPLEPIVLNDALIRIGTDDYELQVHELRFTPTSQTLTYRGIGKGSVRRKQTAPEWVLNLGYAQDYETAQALALRLKQEHGQVVPVVARLAAGDGHEWHADVVMQAGEIGGAADVLLTSSVALAVDGEPERVVVVGG